jgi:hypothetical protein
VEIIALIVVVATFAARRVLVLRKLLDHDLVTVAMFLVGRASVRLVDGELTLCQHPDAAPAASPTHPMAVRKTIRCLAEGDLIFMGKV